MDLYTFVTMKFLKIKHLKDTKATCIFNVSREILNIEYYTTITNTKIIQFTKAELFVGLTTNFINKVVEKDCMCPQNPMTIMLINQSLKKGHPPLNTMI